MFQRASTLLVPLAVATMLVACSGDDATDSPTTDDAADQTTEGPDTSDGSGTEVVDGQPFPDERCETNRAAGTITFLTGFDYAAAASIVEVITAESLGYYDDLCLDVEIISSFSTANYPLVAGGQGQFASGGSFSEVVAFAVSNETELVSVMVAGSTPIDTLIVKPGTTTALADLAGSTIGVKGKLPASVEVMLLGAGLVEDEDYATVPVEGFDPTAHIAIDAIDGFPGWKSNEPGRLEREGIDFDLFDPSEHDVPGSFGAIFTTRTFIDEHPTAVEDFVRATMRGLATAIDDPESAATTAVDLVADGGNPNFLSPEGEVFRWGTEAGLIASRTASATAAGTPDPDALAAEVAAYQQVAFFGSDEPPAFETFLDATLARRVTAPDGTIIWPS